MIFRINDNARISKLQSSATSCSYCSGKLVPGKHYLTINKVCSSGNPIQIWMHPSCLKKLTDDVQKMLDDQEIMKKIMVENL